MEQFNEICILAYQSLFSPSCLTTNICCITSQKGEGSMAPWQQPEILCDNTWYKPQLYVGCVLLGSQICILVLITMKTSPHNITFEK